MIIGLGEALVSGGAKKTGNSALAAMEKSGYLSDEFIQNYKSGASGAVIVGGNFMDYLNELEGLDAKISAENAQQRTEWFGATSSVDVSSGIPSLDKNGNDAHKNKWSMTVNEGYYNPDAIKNLAKWEKEGLIGMLEKDLDNKEKSSGVIKKIEEQLKVDRSFTKEAELLLHGGSDILQMNAERFAQAITDIETAYENAYTNDTEFPIGEKINIQSIFQAQ